MRLRRKLGWDIVTTDRVLSRVLGGTIPADLVETSSFVRLQNQLKLKPAQLTAFWLDLDTRRTDRHTRSVFDEVYLKGDPSSPEYRALDALSRGESDISVSPAPGGSGVLQLDAFKTYLRGALGLSAQDMDELWLAIVLDPSDPQVVGLGELSAMNAVASFCRALKLSVRDFYQAKTLLGADPFPTPGTVDIEATYAALVELRRWRQSGVRLSELAYLLLGVSPSGEDLSPTLEDLEQVHRQFAVRGGEIVARYPDVSAPDAQTMQAHLEEVMPADKAGTATSILETPTASATDEPFLVRYFEAFWPTVATDITAVLALTDAEDRYAEVYRRLRPHLVARARRQAALQVAAESTNAAADVVDQLLTASLTSVAGGSPIPAAIEDWGLGLLGWDDGSETIVDASSTPATRSSRWVVPEDGEYRFIIREAGDTAGATLVLGGDELTLESSVGGESVFGPVTQRAGDVLPIRLDYSGVGSISLLVRRDNGDPEVLPASQLSPFDEQAFVKLDKAVRLARGLSLANSELDYVNFKDATLFDDLNGGGVTWSRLGWLVDQLQLNRRVRLDRTTLFELVREPMPPATDPDPVEDLARIEALTGWKQEDLTAILAITPWDSPPPLLRNIETWFVLERCMALVGKLDLRASQILDLLVTNAPSVSAALTLRDSLRSSFSEDSWRDTFKPLRDKLRQRERDALVGYLTTRPVDIGGVDHYFTDANDLFSYFLIDVEMEPDTQLSRIKLALNAIQLFVQRVFLGLEPERALRQLEKKQEQWKWMSAYRVWEANRKVFLFPENWVEPELRDDKTELFRELEQELLQEEATSERARRMLTKYLERLDEISDLVVVGACTEGVFYAGTSNVLHIVGRTRSAPYVYYHRTFKGRQFDDGVFTPWRKVPIEIEAKSVAPVIVNGGLRLFWPVVTLKDKIAKDADNQGPMQTKAEVRLMWASLIPALGEWAKPRLGSSKVFDYHPVTIFSRDDKDDAPDDSYYHFRTGVEGEGTVKVEIYKTEFPSGGTLKPTVIGVIRVNAAGEDFAQQQNLLMNVGNNHPNGSYLLRNAAIETGSTVEGNAAGTSFTMRGSGAFFQTHMPPFRALVTNFGYLDQAQNEPFFVETPTVSLFALHRGTSRSVGLSADLNQEAHFITFNNPQMPELKSRFTANGPPGIMNRLTEALPMSDGRYYYNYSNSYISANRGAYQSGYNNRYNGYYGGVYLGYHIAGDRMAWGISQRDFEAEFQPGSKSVERPYPLPTIEFGYGTPFGVYNWELFFHLPLLVADRLTQEMRFEEAMDWYHYVFDPRLDLNSYEKSRRFPYKLPGGARYWNFLPFFANKDATDSLLDVFGVKQSLSVYEKEDLKAIVSEWRHNPFNPHLIARQRISAYQKSVVMKYLENLIAWGDQLFRQDSFESINQATQLYVLAAEILGKRPEVIEPLVQEPRYTYRELFAQGIDPFSNALVDVENLMVATSPYLDGRDVDASPPEADGPQNTALASLYFRIPRNEKLDGYWNTVFDRLFKIRNSMNIDGVKRTLALFQPPIDPALLVRAAALGIDLSTALSQLNQPLPYYRFNVWSAKAQDLANELKSFGSSLLGALEKKDAEQLALLRQSQEIRLLGLVKKVREDQLAEAEANIEALEASRALAQDRLDDYSNREFISAAETVSLVLTGVASHLELHAGIANTVGGVLGAIPQVEAGAFSATASFGGLHLASIFSAIASGLNATAGITRAASGLASTLGGYERRQEDWDLQIRQAELEIEQIEKQLAAAEIRRAIAEKELENHEVQIEQSQEVNDFLRGKFTNQELYQWMSTELMRSYRRDYHTISDVVVTVSYTARDGGGTLKLGAANAIETALNRILELVSESPTGLARVFSMKREFPDGLHQLLSSGTTTMSILPQHFPFLLRDKGYTLTPRPEDNGVVTMRVIGKIGASASANVSFAFNQGTPSAAIPVDIAGTVGNVPRGSANLVDDWAPETWTFTQVDSGGAPILPENLTLTPNSVDDVIFELKYLVPEA